MALKVDISKKLKNFTLKIKFTSDNNCMGILGESGCGKSMLLKCIAGIETPDSGVIELDGKMLFNSEKKINLPPQKRNIGFLFQNYALFPTMTVSENIASGIRYKKRFISKNEKEKIDNTTKELIKLCRLEGLESSYPSQLSGGQQQRTALARILAVNPSMIMLDEPFSALDSHLKSTLIKEMHEIIRKYSGNILIVSHSRDELYTLCNTLSVMKLGHILCQGNIKEVFKFPKYVSAAILTGCKNICDILKKDDFKVFSSKWGIELNTNEPITDNISHIGIRAHYFHIADKISDNTNDTANIFSAKIKLIDEHPFEYDYYMQTPLGTDTFIWKIHKSSDVSFNLNDMITLYVNPQDIMLLQEN